MKFNHRITEEEYIELCNVFNQILNLDEELEELIAVPWMHIIREHPEFLMRYQFLFTRNKSILTRIERVKIYLRVGLQKIKQSFSKYLFKGKNHFDNKFQHASVDFLFITHFIDQDSVNQENDFYFGDIPNLLKKMGYNVLVAGVPHFTNEHSYDRQALLDAYIRKWVFKKKMSDQDEHELQLKIKLAKTKINQLIKRQSSIQKKVILEYSMLLLETQVAKTNLRIFEQVKVLLRQTTPRYVIVPYEGHGLERLIFRAAKKSPITKSIAYQHTGTFRLSNAIKQNIIGYNPDYVFVSGSEARDYFKQFEPNFKIPIQVLGSSRGRLTNVNIPSNHAFKSRLSCLVLPEGIMEECTLLFGVSLACAKLLPNVKFIWRVHPIINLNSVLRSSHIFRNIPSNIEISNNTIDEDINSSSWTLYRGTTAVYKAISAGLRPIYFKNKESMTIDPLYKLNFWRMIAKNPQDIVNFFESDIKNCFQEHIQFSSLAIKICDERFAPIDMEVFNKLIHSE